MTKLFICSIHTPLLRVIQRPVRALLPRQRRILQKWFLAAFLIAFQALAVAAPVVVIVIMVQKVYQKQALTITNPIIMVICGVHHLLLQLMLMPVPVLAQVLITPVQTREVLCLIPAPLQSILPLIL